MKEKPNHEIQTIQRLRDLKSKRLKNYGDFSLHKSPMSPTYHAPWLDQISTLGVVLLVPQKIISMKIRL